MAVRVLAFELSLIPSPQGLGLSFRVLTAFLAAAGGVRALALVRETAAQRARRIRIIEMCFRYVCVHVSSMSKFDSLGGLRPTRAPRPPVRHAPGPRGSNPPAYTAPSQGRSRASTDTKSWRPPRQHHTCGQQPSCPCCFIVFECVVVNCRDFVLCFIYHLCALCASSSVCVIIISVVANYRDCVLRFSRTFVCFLG
jgi:hypothetical protein